MAPKKGRGAAANAKAKAQAAADKKVEKKRQRRAALQAFSALAEEVGAGAGQVSKVRAAVNIRFQGGPSKPDTVWTDRGQGFDSPCTGGIAAEYKQALKDNRMKPAVGDDASIQKGDFTGVRAPRDLNSMDQAPIGEVGTNEERGKIRSTHTRRD